MKAVINTLPSEAARRFPAQTALVVNDQALSFAEIEDRVARFAGGLRGLGVVPGARVVLHLPNGWEWVVAYYAIARLGAVVVPANILLSVEEVAYIAADSGAATIIAPSACQAPLSATCARESVELATLILLGETTQADPSSAVAFESVLRHGPVPLVEVEPDDLFTIGYTSGTTGKPKGAMLSHRCVFMSSSLSATIHVRQRGEVVVTALPFPHVYGNVILNAAFLVGMTLVTLERFDAALALQLIERHRATMFEGVPTMFYYMLASLDLEKRDLSSLFRCTVGGQTMPIAKIEAVIRAFGCPLLELWGMTEVAGPATSHSPYLPPRLGSIGQPFPGVEIKIVDVDDATLELPGGEPGEMLVRGPLVTQGYYNNPAATAEAVEPGGWLHTGDIGYRDDDGYLYVVDRKKDMIITAGYKVFPAELEQVIASHPGVAMVAVAAVSDELKGELAKAFVVLRAGSSATESEIIGHCEGRLAAYKMPRLVAFVDDLPKTSTGKIMRRALRS